MTLRKSIKPKARLTKIQQSGPGVIHCLRCNYYWIPRKLPSEIRICPHCKSAYWDVPPDEETDSLRTLVRLRRENG